MRFAVKSSIFLFGMLAVVGCDSGKVSKKNDSGLASLALISLNKPPVDASQLRVYNISAAKTKKGEIWIGSLGYEADGQADLVEFKACHESGTCFVGKSAVNRILMPTFQNGRVTITARACVDPGRSTVGSLCGPESSGEFIQPANNNTKQAELAAQRAQKAEQLKGFSQAVKGVLEKFQRDSDQCVKDDDQNQRILAKKKMTAAYTALGESLIGLGINYAAKAEAKQNAADIETAKKEFDPDFVGPKSERTLELEKAGVIVSEDDLATAKQELDPNYVGPPSPRSLELEQAGIVNKTGDLVKVKDATKQGADSLKTFAGYSGVVRNAMASVDMYQINPVSSIQSLASSVFDMFNADDVKLSPCLAEVMAQGEMNALKVQIQKLQQEISVIDASLIPAQTGVVLP